MLGPRGYLFHCHAALFRRVPLPQSICGQQSADLFHEFFQLLIPSEGKAFILLADKSQCAVDLRKLLRLEKGAFLNEIAADGEIPLGGFIVVLKIMPVMDALSVVVPLPSHKLDAALGGVARQHRAAKVSEAAVVAIQSAGFELRGGFQNRHVFRSHFGGVDYALQRSLRTGGGTLLSVQHAAPAGDATETPFLLSGNEKGRRFFGWSKPTNDAQKFVIFFPR